MGDTEATTAFGAISWDIVDDFVRELGKTSAQIARVDLGSIDDKIATEKRKLKSLCVKHAQACEEVAKARRSATREQSVLVDLHSKLEQDLTHLADSSDDKADNLSKRNVLNVEIAQVKRKLESKRSQHDQYLSTHHQTMKKRERMIQVQGKTIRNLLHRKLALGEIATARGTLRDQSSLRRPEDPVTPFGVSKSPGFSRGTRANASSRKRDDEDAEIASKRRSTPSKQSLGITGQAPRPGNKSQKLKTKKIKS